MNIKKINAILIIGNGFDLYHKLPTKYTDFLFFTKHWNKFKENYEKNVIFASDKPDELIDIRLGSKNELILESLNDFAEHAYLYSKEHIAYLDDHIQENAWLTYFEAIKIPGQNWIDFEEEIYRALSQVELFHNSFRNCFPERLSPTPGLMETVITLFSDMAEKKKTGYRDLLNYKELKLMEGGPEVITQNKLLLLDFMKDELDVLNRCLDYYMLEFVSRIKCKVYSRQIDNLENRAVSLLSFNYTYTFNTMYSCAQNADFQFHPIHGEAKKENIVLGISDESFNDSIDYIYFQKFFQRIQKKTGNDYKKWLENLHENSTMIYVGIIGHSLNKVDKGVLQDFFLDYKSVKNITIFYHNQSSYENLVINLVDMFGKDFVINETASERIRFMELESPIMM